MRHEYIRYYIDTLLPTEADALSDEERMELNREYKREYDAWFARGGGELERTILEPRMIGYLDPDRAFRFLHHPIVKTHYNPEWNHLYNLQFKSKMALVWDLLQELEDRQSYATWNLLFYCYHESYWMTLFTVMKDRMPNHIYWRILGDIWTIVENIWQIDRKDLYAIWDDPKRRGISQYRVMDERALKEYRGLLNSDADEITIYRGYCRPARKNGWSWTTNPNTAWWFAERAVSLTASKSLELKQPKVVSRKVSKDEVLAYFNDRNEYEVIAKPAKNSGDLTMTGKPLSLVFADDAES